MRLLVLLVVLTSASLGAQPADSLRATHAAPSRDGLLGPLRSAGDLLSAGATALDLLAALPDLSLTPDGTLLGPAGDPLSVVVDGLPLPAGGSVLNDLLRTIAAEGVSQIRVGSAPSMASAVGGTVVNLVLATALGPGATGSLTGLGTTQGGGGVLGLVSVDRPAFQISGSVRLDDDDTGEVRTRTQRLRTLSPPRIRALGDSTGHGTTDRSASLRLRRPWGRAVVEADVQASLATSATVLQATLEDRDADGLARRSGLRTRDTEGDRQAVALQLGSRVPLGPATAGDDAPHEVAVRLRAGRSSRSEVSDQTETRQEAAGAATTLSEAFQRSGHRPQLGGQLDYSRPLGPGWTLRTGALADGVREVTRSVQARSDGARTQTRERTLTTARTEQAAYAELVRRSGTAELHGGLRLERRGSSVSDRDLGGADSVQASARVRLGASVAAALAVGPRTRLRAHLTHRTVSPDERALDATASYAGTQPVVKGDPGLPAAGVTAAEAAARYRLGAGSVEVKGFGQWATGQARVVRSVSEEGDSAYRVVSARRTTRLGVEARGQVAAGRLRATAVVTAGQISVSGLPNEGVLRSPLLSVRALATWALPTGATLQATAGVRARDRTARGLDASPPRFDLALNQPVLGGLVDLTLRVHDPFGWNGGGSLFETDTFFEEADVTTGQRRVEVDIRLALGR